MSRRARLGLKVGVWGACLLPLLMLLDRFWTGQLGANPISYVTNVLGDTTLRILLASLSLTPLRLLLRVSWQMSLRRLLGLFAFFYGVLHFSVWVVVDQFFDWAGMLADVRKRPYITVGVLALSLLVPLAATSTTGMIKRLGGANWQRLHRLVYVTAVLAILHFLWLAKKGRNDQFVYAAVLALLLGVRLWDRARRALRGRASGRGVAATATARRVAGLSSSLPAGQAEGRQRLPGIPRSPAGDPRRPGPTRFGGWPVFSDR